MRTKVVSFSNSQQISFSFSSERPNFQLGTKTKDRTINGHGRLGKMFKSESIKI